MELSSTEDLVDFVRTVWECEICGAYFTKEHCYESHKKWKHSENVSQILQCEKCQMVFSRRFNLKRHQSNCKGTVIKNSTILEIKCFLCDFCGHSNALLFDHYINIHNQKLVRKSLEFESFDQFEKWKDSFEKESKSHYVKNSSTKVLKNGVSTCKYYCHRSGYFKSKSKGIRCDKILGTNKLNSYCPAQISVRISDNKCVNIEYVDIHLGHDNELGRLVISKSEKAAIAQKLALKIPFNEILDELRDSVTDNNLDRVHLLTRKDLWNIVDAFNLNNKAVLHKNDHTSVDAWVNHMQASSNIIRCYKSQGPISELYPELKSEDFFLVLMNDAQLEILKKFGNDCICVDGTHGLNAYDFQLFTVMVLDDVRQGFPCCFLFCNRSDTAVMMLYFKIIKECMNSELISPKIFMSDMEDTFYNAWSAVFEPVMHHLYCSWHVDRAWRNSLGKIINKEKQAIIYKKLKILMFETDEESFNIMIINFYNDLIHDPDTTNFGNYFKKYIDSCECWAYCYRKHCGINTNMSIENMHKIIKYFYFDGKKVKRMDKAIFLIMKFIRDKLFDRLVILQKGKISNKLSDLRKKHKTSLQLNSTIIQVNNCWTVSSSSKNDIYKVEKVCINCNCQLKCSECEVCIHQFMCTCIDYSVKWNMCKHIHFVCTYLKGTDESKLPSFSPNEFSQEPSQNSFSSNIEFDTIMKDISSNSASYDRKKSYLMQSFLESFNNIKNEKQLDAVLKHIAPIPSIVNALASEADINFPLVQSNEPPNKKIRAQRFTSTKKKATIRKREIKNPTKDEIQKLSLNMVDPSL